MKERNPFGGGNAKSLYVPMSETEQEVISRLVEEKNLEVVVHGWGLISEPKVTVGDAQVMIPISVRFDKITYPVQVSYFDLELRTKTGICLFKERQSAEYDGKPLVIGSGTELSMIWHIGVKCMDPAVVKSILPGAIGLTSRVLDKEKGVATVLGNMKLDETKKKMLANIRRGEARVREEKAKTLKRSR